ncbi:MAG: RNA methyltransferase [Desulfobacterales bacterium]|nr:RNA methyltransferase [Desulfobacterales bacterium]
MSTKVIFENVSIVLHRPRFPENIGAAARAMRNMGIDQLVVVDPLNFDLDKVLKMATHEASNIVEQIKIFGDLQDALSSYNYVVGTTARLGRQRTMVDSPAEVAERLISISRENHIAVVFGPEDRGLSNDDLRYCHGLVNIPTAEFSSLNLAQAVMIMCYEIFVARQVEYNKFIPRLADRYELEGMYAQLKDILVRISFINADNPDYWLNNLRRFFNRLPLRSREVNIIRGICRQINWYGEKRYQDGKQAERR